MLQQKAEKYAKKKEHSEDALAYCNNYGAYRPGMSREEVADYYSSWADKYEIMLHQKAEKYAKKKEHSEDALAYCNNYGAYRPGLSREEVADYYSSWADKYEIINVEISELSNQLKEYRNLIPELLQSARADNTNKKYFYCFPRWIKWAESNNIDCIFPDLSPERYNGPIICCNVISECFPEEREKVKILDIACGSGTLGELLKKQGFYNIDGLDPSDGMLKLAKEKKCYNNLYCEFMTSNVPIQKGTYDCAAVVGGMGEGHIPCEGLHIMAHIVKPGGYVVIVMRLEYIQHVEEYKDRLEPLMQQMEDQGIWVMESRTIVERYAFGNDGVIFKFRVC